MLTLLSLTFWITLATLADVFTSDDADSDEAEPPDDPIELENGITYADGIVTGTDGNDDLSFASEGDPIVAANCEVDEIRGGDGDDRLASFLSGADILRGGDGNDTFSVENGNSVYGDNGDDVFASADWDLGNDDYSQPLISEVGAATVTGGAGADSFVSYNTVLEHVDGDTLVIADYDRSEDQIFIDFGDTGSSLFLADAINSLRIEQDGDDALVIYDAVGQGDDQTEELFTQTIRVVGAADLTLDDLQLHSAGHNDAFSRLVSGTEEGDQITLSQAESSGAEFLFGRSFGGDDSVSVEDGFYSSTVALGDGNDSFTGNGVVYLEAGNDSADLADGGVAYGGAGDDTISAATGIATINGGAGDDEISGNSGSSLFGDDGDDHIQITDPTDPDDSAAYIHATFGGAGADTVEGSSGTDRIYDGDLQSGQITFGDIDFASDNDAYDGGDGDDILSHAGGDDTLLGGAGNDTLWSVHFDSPTQGEALFDGGAGNDTILGSLGDGDTLLGGDGDDLILSAYEQNGYEYDEDTYEVTYFHDVGDDTSETLSGGNGDDTIVFDQNDTVTGGSGADDLRLTLHDFVSDTGGAGIATITDFDRAEDVLTVYVENIDAADLTVVNDATGSSILINGSVVAVVDGVTDLTEDDVTMIAGGPLSETTHIDLVY